MSDSSLISFLKSASRAIWNTLSTSVRCLHAEPEAVAIAVNGVCVNSEIDNFTPPQWEAEQLKPYGDSSVDAVGD